MAGVTMTHGVFRDIGMLVGGGHRTQAFISCLSPEGSSVAAGG